MENKRVCYGHTFVYILGQGIEPTHWESTAGNKVWIIPSERHNESWFVYVVTTRRLDEFTGEDAEERAFCTAEVYTHQSLTPPRP